jgi:hypothetical protein
LGAFVYDPVDDSYGKRTRLLRYFPDTSKYLGDFKKEGFFSSWRMLSRHGQGISQRINGGDCYEGNWKDDKRHGKGRYIYSDGSWYLGNWKNDKYEG